MSNDEELFDHREPGWFLPRVQNADQVARVKAALGGVAGPEQLRWRHDGVEYLAEVGEPLAFGGVDVGAVMLIRLGGSLHEVLTISRNPIAPGAGPIQVGDTEIVR